MILYEVSIPTSEEESESSTTGGAKYKADQYVQYTKTTAFLKEQLQSKSISSSNTRIEALILGRGPKYDILKKQLAEFGSNPSTTREV